MIFNTQEILFFSLSRITAISFERFIRYSNKEFIEKHSLFQLIREQNGEAKTFKHLQELLFFLDNLKLIRLSNLILLIDIYSLDHSSDKEDRQFIKEIVVRYPEVKINFISINNDWKNFFTRDTSLSKPIRCNLSNQTKCSVYKILTLKNREPHNTSTIKIPHIHSFNLFEKKSFDLLVRSKSNLFDASNLRNFIKQDFYERLTVQTNYPKSQCSRLNHFALAVEEEISLAYFNGYSLYVNGYRTIPISSYLELVNFFTDCSDSKTSSPLDEIGLDIIIRDYDLQFEDNVGNVRLYELRGLKQISTEEKNINWEALDVFWKNYNAKVKTFFITRFNDNRNDEKPYINNQYFKNKGVEYNSGIAINSKNAILRGLSKPINGIYALHEISDIENVYKAARDDDDISINREGKEGHSIPAFIYHIADNLIKRSQKYYDAQMYLLSALLAKEANEILNGFHFSMTLEAIYLQAVAETNLETDILGTEEEKIAISTSKRLSDIKAQVERFCKFNDKAKKNVLTQIYNDIRHICRQKEQFKAADIALAELINARFGSNLWK